MPVFFKRGGGGPRYQPQDDGVVQALKDLPPLFILKYFIEHRLEPNSGSDALEREANDYIDYHFKKHLKKIKTSKGMLGDIYRDDVFNRVKWLRNHDYESSNHDDAHAGTIAISTAMHSLPVGRLNYLSR